MRYTYWHHHPRGFANECSLVKASTRQQGEALREMGYTRLTLRQLRAHVRHMNDENEAWGSNRAFGAYSIDAILSYTAWAAAAA